MSEKKETIIIECVMGQGKTYIDRVGLIAWIQSSKKNLSRSEMELLDQIIAKLLSLE